MSSELDFLAKRFCRELAADTGNHSMQWRPVLVIGVRCRIRSPGMLDEIVEHAAKARWLIADNGQKVALTEAGLALVRDAPWQPATRRRDKSRLSS